MSNDAKIVNTSFKHLKYRNMNTTHVKLLPWHFNGMNGENQGNPVNIAVNSDIIRTV